MGDLLDRGAAWLEDQRTRHLSRAITYVRGGSSVVLQATIGRTEFEQADEYGALRRTQSRDFLVLAKDLVLGGAAAMPQSGDRIREAEGARIFLYEVMAPGGEPPWRYSDVSRRTFRVHTKFIGTESVS